MAVDFNEALQAARGVILLVIAAGGGGAAVAYGLFRWLGQQWLEQHFKTQIEKLRHDQNKEIEGLRHKIQSLFSRISKIHDKEFEVLPKAWFLLHDAHGKAGHLMIAMKYRPDFERMPDLKFDDFLKHCRLSEYEREELRNARDRRRYYNEAIFWIELNDAESSQMTFHNYLIENRIFMTQELREKFSAVDDVLSKALIEHRIGKEASDGELFRESIDKVTHLSEKIAEVEQAVQVRLRYADA